MTLRGGSCIAPEELCAEIVERAPRGATFLLGIDGPGASGKSTLARAIAGAGGFAIVEVDDFYKPSGERGRSSEGGRVVGIDFDLERLERQVLAPLAQGRAAAYERYDWQSDCSIGCVELPPGGVVIVEGIYSTQRALAEYYDFRIWVGCAREKRLRRGLVRDGEQAKDRWLLDWMPKEDAYVEVEQPDEHADLVLVSEGSSSAVPSLELRVLRRGAHLRS